MREETLSDKIVTDPRSQCVEFIHAPWVKDFIADILEEIKLECKLYDMLYGEVGNKKISYKQIEQIIKHKAGDKLL